MLKEQNTAEAINALAGGGKVMVMTSFDETDGSCMLIPLKSFLDRYKFLVDVKTEKEPDPASQEPQPTRPSSKAGGKRAKVDRGKVLALHKAGRSNKWIAEDMGLHEGTVYRILKEVKEEGQDEED